MSAEIWQDDMGVWVQLSLTELLHGCLVGAVRHHESVSRRRPDKHGFDASQNSGLSIHAEGACGEIAVAKARGRYWGGLVNTFKGADLGANVQVKTRSRHDYDLLVRKDDNPDHVFVLVTGTAPTFCVRGWLYGRDAQLDCFVKTHGGREAAYFVPADKLKPMSIQKPVEKVAA